MCGHRLAGDDLKIIRVFAVEGGTVESNSDSDVVILLDTAQQDDMVCAQRLGCKFRKPNL